MEERGPLEIFLTLLNHSFMYKAKTVIKITFC